MSSAAPRRAAPWLLAIALAALFTAFQIQSSLHSGSLSLPVTYDDVGYFNDVLPRLNVLYRDGGWALLKGFWVDPLHAPIQELLALLGFGLFGPHPWSAYAMNAIPLALMLRLFMGYASRSLSLATSAVLAAAFLGFPLLGMLVLEFRPDMLCALLTAAGALVIVADPSWREGNRASLVIAAALFAGALLAKPTLAPVTAFVFAVAAIATIALHSTSRHEATSMGLRALACGTLGLLIALPYYASHFASIFQYIWVNAFGSQSSVWRPTLSWSGHALYYLTGPSGKAAIGWGWLAVIGGLLVAAMPTVLRAHRKTAWAALAVAVAAYLSVTLPGMKSQFIGLIVPAFVLGIGVILAIMLLRPLPQSIAFLAAIVLLGFSAAAWSPVYLRLTDASVSATQAQHFARIYTQTVDAIASVPDLDRRRLYLPVIAQYLNTDNVKFELLRRRLPPPGLEWLYFDGDIETHKKAIARADIVVLFSDDSTLPVPWLASTKIRKEINAAVEASGSFETVATVDGGPYQGRVMVLRRKSAPA